MRVLVLCDSDCAMRESAMLARLEIAMADEGIRCIHAVPEACLDRSEQAVYSTVVGYETATLAPPSVRLSRLVRQLDGELDDDNVEAIDIVHCFGRRTWHMGIGLASRLDSAIVLEVQTTEDLHAARRMRCEQPLRIVVPEQAILDEAGKATQRIETVIPWGVSIGSTIRAPRLADRPPTIAIRPIRRDSASMDILVDGLAIVNKSYTQMVVFLEQKTPGLSRLRRRIRSRGLERSVVLTPDLEHKREPVLKADMLVVPGAFEPFSTLALDAMAHGMLVVAQRDPQHSMLIDGRTARVLDTPTADDWSRAIILMLEDPIQAEAMLKSAHAQVREHRSGVRQVTSVLAEYEQIHAARQAVEVAIAEQVQAGAP